MDLEQFRQIVEHARDVIVVTEAAPLDEPGPKIVYVNTAFTRLTGYTSQEVIGRSPRFLQPAGSVDLDTLHAIRSGLNSGDGFNGPILNVSKNGTLYWLDMHIFALCDETGKVTHFAAIERDITARVMRELELRDAAITDPLTGLFNRRALERKVPSAESSSVLILDLDRFKSLNDNHGHLTGDQTLRRLAQAMTTVAGDDDYPVRLGGDEFLLVLPGVGLEDALRAASRVQDEFAYLLITSHLPPTTVSIGVATGTGDLSELIDQADAALRRAKRAGRNLVTS